MKLKKILLFPVLTVLIAGLSACTTTEEEYEKDDGTSLFTAMPKNQTVPIEELVNYIMSNTEAYPRCEMNPGHAFADSGFSVFIGKKKTPVAFYKYNWKKKKMRKKLAKIKESGYLYLTFIRYKAVVNGCFVMINYDKCEDPDKLVELFQNF